MGRIPEAKERPPPSPRVLPKSAPDMNSFLPSFTFPPVKNVAADAVLALFQDTQKVDKSLKLSSDTFIKGSRQFCSLLCEIFAQFLSKLCPKLTRKMGISENEIRIGFLISVIKVRALPVSQYFVDLQHKTVENSMHNAR